MTAQELTDDVNRLCLQHQVTLRVMPGCHPVAYPIPRIVHALPIVTGKEYCETLHEIGHVVLNHRPEQPREYKEILAWRWAFWHSAEWTKQMADFKAWALGCWGITNPSKARSEKVLLDEFSSRV